MCDVCAVFGAGEHWSDFGRLRDERFPYADIRHYRAERRRRIAMLQRILAPLGVSCADWDGEAYLLRDAAGRQAVVPTLGDVWPAAERLGRHRLDPLQPGFLHGGTHG